MKWQKLSYKSRGVLIILITLFVLLLAVLFPVRRTIEAKTKVIEIDKKIASAIHAPDSIALMKLQIGKWSKLVTTNITEEVIQIKLFEEVGVIGDQNEVEIKVLKELSKRKDREFILKNFDVEMTGKFNNLLKALHCLEGQLLYGQILSVRFEKRRLKGGKKEKLYMNLLIQSIIKDDQNN
ncbi:MAG: hypothetical protein N4A74_19100 [Carboxylicivirga sp.]|jgi:hypothetical protein|nr:hypothetical protein [Carboxylicivirga sp.]